MFGDETLDVCSVKEQHINAERKVKLKGDIALFAALESYERQLRGSGLFVFERVFGATLTHARKTSVLGDVVEFIFLFISFLLKRFPPFVYM